MAGSSDYQLEPKNIDAMLAGLTKAAKSKGFKFKGNKKAGSATSDGATIKYVVKGKKVTVSASVEWDLSELDRLLDKWLKPYS